MATTTELEAHRREEEQTAHAVAGGSIGEALAGAGAAVLALLGLGGILPLTLAAIATIVVGAALLMEGGGVAARYSDLLAETIDEPWAGRAAFGTGVAAETVGGIAGVILGVLALLTVAPVILMGSAAVVFGAALLLGSSATARLSGLAFAAAHPSPMTERLSRDAVLAAAGGQVLVGIAAVTLGILAIIGVAAPVLVLVALLALGASTLINGTAVGGRMMRFTRA